MRQPDRQGTIFEIPVGNVEIPARSQSHEDRFESTLLLPSNKILHIGSLGVNRISTESSMVSIEGGEHKFWDCCIYQKTDKGFTKLHFDPEPVDKLNELTKIPSSVIVDMGVHNYYKNPHQGEIRMVYLLDNNYIATDTHPATCSHHFINSGGGFKIKPGSHLNFLFHLDSKGEVEFVGFCQ